MQDFVDDQMPHKKKAKKKGKDQENDDLLTDE